MVSEINLPGGRTSPHYMDIWKRTDENVDSQKKCGRPVTQVVSPMHRSPLRPSRYPWDLFMLEAESNPRPQWGRKD